MPWVGGEMPDAFVRVLADFAVHVFGCVEGRDQRSWAPWQFVTKRNHPTNR